MEIISEIRSSNSLSFPNSVVRLKHYCPSAALPSKKPCVLKSQMSTWINMMKYQYPQKANISYNIT